jgi:hypothetical protein
MTTRGPILSALLIILTVGCGVRIGTNTGPLIEGSGKTAVEDRKVEGFQQVHARNAIEVVVAIAGPEAAKVEGDDNLLPLVETMVENGVLEIGVKGNLRARNPLRVHVTAKQLSGLTADGSAKLTCADVKADELVLGASSAGQVTADNLDAKQLKVSVTSAGIIKAGGRADRQEIDASTSGRYEGSKLVSRTCRVTCSTAANVALHATEEISGSVSSAGRVRQTGSAAKVNLSTTSAGTVQAEGK